MVASGPLTALPSIVQRQAGETQEGEVVLELVLGPLIGEHVQRLQDQDLEHQHGIIGRTAASAPVRALQRRFGLPPPGDLGRELGIALDQVGEARVDPQHELRQEVHRVPAAMLRGG